MTLQILRPRRRVTTLYGSYIDFALARCKCGQTVELSDPLDNECRACHRWYNMCGQEVLDPNSLAGRRAREDDDRFADD